MTHNDGMHPLPMVVGSKWKVTLLTIGTTEFDIDGYRTTGDSA